ncbi:MAG TPA: glycosyltransferase [Polyangia bacterium]
MPRRPYTPRLPGIPTIRPFGSRAGGIPLTSAPWVDSEHLFEAGHDHLLVNRWEEMQEPLRSVLADGARVQELRAFVAKLDAKVEGPQWVGASQEWLA